MGVNIISPQDSGGLGLGAQGYQVINIFHLLERGRVFFFFCIHQTTQEMCIKYYYLGTSEELKQRIWGEVCPRKVP